jgi:hypothetical protein
MREIVRTNDVVLITAIDALLKGAGIRHTVLDQNMSVLEGSLGMLPRRVLVDDDNVARARRSAGGWSCASRGAAIGSAMTRSCSPPRSMPRPGRPRSNSAPGSAPRASRWRNAFPD